MDGQRQHGHAARPPGTPARGRRSPPDGPPAPSALDPEQERRIGELELRLRQLEEHHRRTAEEHNGWFGWTRKVRISGYLQPQSLWQWNNIAASTSYSPGATTLPPGVGSNDVIAKQPTELGTGAPGITTNNDYFRIRRARLKVELEPNEYSRFVMEIDPNLAGGVDSATGTIARNVEAQGIAKWAEDAETTFGMGIFKIPYGWEVLQSDADRPFIERSWWEQNVTPGEFDTGAKAYTTALDHHLTGKFAVINGVTQGEKTFALLPGQTQGKSMVGRINYDFGAVDIGTSGYYGQGAEVNLASMAFKEFPREAWNLEVGLHHRFLEIGQTRLLAEFNLGQNMDRGTKYAPRPARPAHARVEHPGRLGHQPQRDGRVRPARAGHHALVDAGRPVGLLLAGHQHHEQRAQHVRVVGVVHFTKQLQLMVEYNKFVDNVRDPVNATPTRTRRGTCCRASSRSATPDRPRRHRPHAPGAARARRARPARAGAREVRAPEPGRQREGPHRARHRRRRRARGTLHPGATLVEATAATPGWVSRSWQRCAATGSCA